MKEIKAIIEPFKLDEVLSALEALPDLPGVTISQVRGWGRFRRPAGSKPETEPEHAFAPKTKLEIVVTDELAPSVLAVIAETARTGNVGDGKVFVSDVEQVVRIRTGEAL